MEPAKKIAWVPMQNGQFPPFSVAGGIDSTFPLYVARVAYDGGLIPGKLFPQHGCTYFPYAEHELKSSSHEVLTCPPNTLTWNYTSYGDIPSNAVVGGKDPNGDRYYIGRVPFNNSVAIGKVHRANGCCYISYAGKEHRFTFYEILVRTQLGVHLDV